MTAIQRVAGLSDGLDTTVVFLLAPKINTNEVEKSK